MIEVHAVKRTHISDRSEERILAREGKRELMHVRFAGEYGVCAKQDIEHWSVLEGHPAEQSRRTYRNSDIKK